MRSLGTLLAAILFGGSASAQSSRFWRPEERTVVSDYSYVRALAGDQTELFIATDNGLLFYQHQFGRWLAPLSFLDGYPMRSVTSAIADPSDGSVWLGTRTGVIHYSPRSRTIDSVTVSGGVVNLMFDRERPFDGVYLRTARGWEFLPRGAFQPGPGPRPTRPLAPASLGDVLRRYPTLDASRAFTLLDSRLRQRRYTSAFQFPSTERLALGTDGAGAFIYDPLSDRYEPLEYGLLSQGAGSVFIDGDDVWIGSSGTGFRNGFTKTNRRLDRFEYVEGPRAVGFGFRAAYDVEVVARDIWAGTDRGLLVVEEAGNVTEFGNRLPGDQVLSLLSVPNGMWVGTDRGLAFVDSEMQATVVQGAGAFQVFGLAAARDSLWLATSAGIAVVGGPDQVVGVPVELFNILGLTDPLTAVTASGDTLVAAGQRGRLFWNADGRWVTETRTEGLGSVFALRLEDGVVWFGGLTGFGYLRLEDGFLQLFNARGDLPGPVRDIALSEDHLWLATDGGLVRFERRALR